MVKNRGRETSFKTMGIVWEEKGYPGEKETEHEVSKATSLKTIENTSNISISFKTFDD